MAPALKGGTAKDQKVAMPHANKSDRMDRRYDITTYGHGDANDEGEDELHDERPNGESVK